MKILHLSSDYKWTGPAEPMVNAVAGLRGRGHTVDLCCAAPPSDAEPQLLDFARERGVEPVLLLEPRSGFRPWRDRGEVRRLANLFDEVGYDLVHGHHTRDQLMSFFAARGRPIRRVVSWHNGDPIPGWPWSRWHLGPRMSHGLAVLSPSLREQGIHDLGWSEDRVAVVPGSVDVERFVPRQAAAGIREELGLDEKAVPIGAARVSPTLPSRPTVRAALETNTHLSFIFQLRFIFPISQYLISPFPSASNTFLMEGEPFALVYPDRARWLHARTVSGHRYRRPACISTRESGQRFVLQPSKAER